MYGVRPSAVAKSLAAELLNVFFSKFFDRAALMKLAWQNIIHDRGRFSVTVLGVSFAVFLMVFQGSLLVGFLRAASRLIDASDSDIWITARGVQAFEFGTPIEGRVREM